MEDKATAEEHADEKGIEGVSEKNQMAHEELVC